MDFDLDDLDEEYVKAPIEERGGNVPDGQYVAKVDSAILKESKQGNRMLAWDLVIHEGPYKGRHLFRNNMLETAENLKWLKNDLHSIGIELVSIKLLPSRLSDIVGLVLKVTAKAKGENQNVYLNGRSDATGADDIPF